MLLLCNLGFAFLGKFLCELAGLGSDYGVGFELRNRCLLQSRGCLRLFPKLQTDFGEIHLTTITLIAVINGFIPSGLGFVKFWLLWADH